MRPSKAVHRLNVVLVLMLLLETSVPFSLAMQAQKPDAPTSQDSSFTEQAASKLLDQVAEGLNGRIAKKMLSAFDLNRMNGGAVFKDQISAFFNQTDSIRVRFKLLEVTDNVATVDAELDVTPNGDLAPAQHKHTQLRFAEENSSGGGDVVEVMPGIFF